MLRRNAPVKALLVLTPLLVVLVATGASAQQGEYVCAPARAVECDADLNCGPPAFQRPGATFFHVDLDDQAVTLLAPAERRGETTPIRFMERDGDRVIVSGVQEGRAWSLIWAEADGSMTLTGNLGDAGWVIFGKCIPADQLSP